MKYIKKISKIYIFYLSPISANDILTAIVDCKSNYYYILVI